MSPEYRRCTRCVMDTTDRDIHFDASGQCNHCTDFLARTSRLVYQGEESQKLLEPIVDRMRRQGRGLDYDCVMGISGGVDSCYAAYVAKGLGLRPLAVHMDNGWNSDTAVRNIKNVTERLGIEYTSYVLDWGEFRDLQLAFLRASVPEIETPTDIAIPAALHRVAAELGVKTIISGGNYATEGILPKSWHYDAKDVTYLKGIHRRFGQGKLKTFPTFGFVAESYFKFVKGIRILYLLNYVPFSKSDAMDLLQTELGWKDYGGKHYESRITGFVQSYLLPVKFDLDYRKATLSTQICAGDATREQALAELELPPYDAERIAIEKEYIARKFEISLDELEAIVKAPPKTHHDYPNAQRRLEFLYAVYRRWLG